MRPAGSFRRISAAAVGVAGGGASLYLFSGGIDEILRCGLKVDCGPGYVDVALAGAGFVASVWLACWIWFKLPSERAGGDWLGPTRAWLAAYRWKAPLVIALYLAGDASASPWWLVPGALALWTAEMDARGPEWSAMYDASGGRQLLYWAIAVAAFDAVATSAAAYMVGLAVAVAGQASPL